MVTTTDAAPAVPHLELDPYETELLRHPDEFHARLREAAPLVWLPAYGIFATGRYAQVRAGLKQWEDLTSTGGAGLVDRRSDPTWTPSVLLHADPPVHTPRRKLMDRILSPAGLQQYQPRFAAAAEGLVDAVLERGGVDGIRDLAEAYTLQVFSEVIGLDDAVRPHLMPFSEVAFNAAGPDNELRRRSVASAGPATAAIEAQLHREALHDDGIGAQIYAAIADAGRPAQEAPQLVRGLLTAGVDTTVAALGAALHCLATHPGQWELVRRDPTRARVAFEEAIRLQSPVPFFFRTTVREADLGGVTVPADSRLLICMAAANRDPRRFDEPDRYDVTRAAFGHVGFGFGVHRCVGQYLSRSEGEALITALAAKVARIELAADPVRRVSNGIRGWSSLPLTLVPA